jgi:hypothetical protein
MSSTGWIAAIGCSERTSGDSLNVDETVSSAGEDCQHSPAKIFESFVLRSRATASIGSAQALYMELHCGLCGLHI